MRNMLPDGAQIKRIRIPLKENQVVLKEEEDDYSVDVILWNVSSMSEGAPYQIRLEITLDVPGLIERCLTRKEAEKEFEKTVNQIKNGREITIKITR